MKNISLHGQVVKHSNMIPLPSLLSTLGKLISRPLSVASLTVLPVILIAGCGRHSEPAKPQQIAATSRTLVTIAVAETKGHAATEQVMGTVRARLKTSIEAKVPARIESVLVAPGHTVNAGQLLIQLDAREIQSRLDQAVPVLRNAESEVKRFKNLVEQRAVSQSEFEATEARFRVAQALVTEAEVMLGHTKIVAPFAGVITRKLVDVGDLATPGRPLLELEDPKALRIEVDVPESLISRVQLGATLHVIAPPFSDTVPATVSEVAPAADSATRTFLVKLDLPGDTKLRAGQFARLSILLERGQALRIPASAVLHRGQMEIVFVADGGKARLRLIKTGKRVGDDYEVVSGIEPGEHVVASGAAELKDGQIVEVRQ